MPEIKATDPYGCHNKRRPIEMTSMQDGWKRDGWDYHPRIKSVPFRMSVTCQYDKSGFDPRCADCKHHNPENAIKYTEKNEGSLALTLLGTTPEEYAEFKAWRMNK